MAASGLAQVAEAAEMAMDRKSPRVHLLQLNAIFSGTFDKNTTCSSADIAKCLERLNGVLPAAHHQPYLKSAQRLNGFNLTYTSTRLGRSPSTDSIAASNFSSDQGSVDSCHYSSNGSDSNSGSAPCSPEEPDRFSRSGTPQPMPPIPPSLQEEDEDDIGYDDGHRPGSTMADGRKRVRNDNSNSSGLCDRIFQGQSSSDSRISLHQQGQSSSDSSISSQQGQSSSDSRTSLQQGQQSSSFDSKRDDTNSENIKHFYLESCCPVPNSDSTVSSSSSFHRTEAANCEQSREGSIVSETSRSSSSHCSLSRRAAATTVALSSSSRMTNQSNCSSSNELLQRCHWQHCESSLEGNAELVEHIGSQHVQVQKDKESFVCLWKGCKVYNRASCSLSWLERHVLSHGGNRPFKCIVDNCSQRFPTQAALQRHVNSHFENGGNSNSQGGGGKAGGKCRDESFPSKSFKRKKHLKYKKRSSHGRTEDFFDANIMEQIRYKLVESHSYTSILNNPRCITFHSRDYHARTKNFFFEYLEGGAIFNSFFTFSMLYKYLQVKARRTSESGKVNVLLEWTPKNMLPDCWVSQESVIKYKTVPISTLPPESLAFLDFSPTDSSDTPRVKQRRK